MSFLEAIISGIVQGLTEFLPVSSSGHLVILHKLFGLKEPQLTFNIFLHLGTLSAVFIVFWRDIIDIFTIRKKIGFFIIIATAATAIFVFIFGKGVEALFGNSRLVGAMLILTGSWLIIGSFVRFGTSGLTGFKSFLIGIAQGVASIPGISRSGATISTALFLGVEPRNAARFSFLLSIPAIIGAFLFKIRQGGFEGFGVNHIFGFFTSCIIGVFSLKLLLRSLESDKLHFFGFYCIAAGLVTVILL
ncbi:MAG: undecaprenyl-diphosphate phosphatase [Candidatus Omnitrophica bacterium]|nr:undecaprenyl-diphosphate phosphatase [Candidatus Omnitrophota bacterium]MBU1932605.1 undecaprenyl-diphosphate phosphatase [Candidatus Omnitrophota bacterium]